MRNILQEIKENKLQELNLRKKQRSIADLESSAVFSKKGKSISQAISDPSKNGLITEFKRQSPSKGIIRENAQVDYFIETYQNNGASAISVLHDQDYFGADKMDLKKACEIAQIPILQKDFIVDSYQIIEAKAIGADAILLIAKILEDQQIKDYIDLAHQIGLEVLLETQSQEEIERCKDLNFDLIGINNRNLINFQVDIQNSIELAKRLPSNAIKIAESGLDSPKVIKTLKENGFNGFLMGEYFMRKADPKQALCALINQLNA
ncbi:indole-3-glycerol phosphate synthase TrpC [Myroides sp. LJL115]